jgi:AraC-like DNA-binding protein
VIKNRTAPVGADRTTITRPEHISSLFRFQQGVGVHGRNKPFALTHRVGALGPLTVLDLTFGADTWVRCAEERPYYQVNVLAAGEMDLLHRGSSIASSPGLATVCVPHGDLHVSRWGAGTRMIALRFERSALEDALSEAVGQQLSAQIDFKRSVTTSKGPARTWMRMSSVLIQELFRTDSAISQPLVASSFVDTLIRALLLGIDHPYREMLTTRVKCSAPQTIRPAVDLIEAEPQRPLTVASLAGQCHISSRALQQSFVRYMGISPIAYLRQVRLRRAHQELLAADPSVETVASIAKRWGYTNPGRFAAAHAARYGEAPASTLDRSRQAVPGPNPS